ncbi:MAG: hypothetical protein AABZ39_21125 [Spirochaetota bacterium]
MSETTDKMSKNNWLMFGAGIAVLAFGFFLLNLVGRNPEGPLGFFAPVTILAGIIITTVGFLIK